MTPPRREARTEPAAAGTGEFRAQVALLLAVALAGGSLLGVPSVPGARGRLTAQQTLLQVERGTVRRDGVAIHWEASGRGPALVFLHDGLTHAGVWDDLFAELAQDHRVLRYDRRGYGQSGEPQERYSPLGDLTAVMDAAGVARATLVGAAWGGGLALAFALAHPVRVEALVLVGAMIPGYGFSEHFTSRGFRNTAPLLDEKPDRALERWVEDPWILAPTNRGARKRLRALLEPYFEKQMALRPDLIELPEPNLLPHLPDVRVPALILIGESDIADMHAHAGVLDARLPDARRVVLPRAGHLVPLERPEELARQIRSFLEDGVSEKR